MLRTAGQDHSSNFCFTLNLVPPHILFKAGTQWPSMYSSSWEDCQREKKGPGINTHYLPFTLWTCFTLLSFLEGVLAQGSIALQQQNTKATTNKTQGVSLTPIPNPFQPSSVRGNSTELKWESTLWNSWQTRSEFPEAKYTKCHPSPWMYAQVPLQFNSHKEDASWILYLPKKHLSDVHFPTHPWSTFLSLHR